MLESLSAAENQAATVPLAPPLGKRHRSSLGGMVLASLGMALLPASASVGLAVLIAALVLLYTGINLQRSPFQALIADAVPSRDRSLATASVAFQMCVGAIAFLMLGRVLGMTPAFVTAGVTILAIAVALRVGVREPTGGTSGAEVSFASLARATWATLRGAVSSMRAIFLAVLLLQLTFQTFTTWFALHATERFGLRRRRPRWASLPGRSAECSAHFRPGSSVSASVGGCRSSSASRSSPRAWPRWTG